MMKIICALALVLVSIAYSNAGKARIVGGHYAEEGAFPYQISLQRWGSHTCGGSILNSKWILTAAHCVTDDGNIEPQPASEFNVQAGSTILNRGGVNRKVKRIIVHRQYGNFINDLALLELENPLPMSAMIQAIPLMTSEVPANSPVLISGWGRVGTTQDISTILKYNFLTSMSQQQCRPWRYDKPEVVCLGHTQDNGACMGDSGGPAVLDGKLIGVASFVMGGCGSRNPDAYVKVSHYLNWISDNMRY